MWTKSQQEKESERPIPGGRQEDAGRQEPCTSLPTIKTALQASYPRVYIRRYPRFIPCRLYWHWYPSHPSCYGRYESTFLIPYLVFLPSVYQEERERDVRANSIIVSSFHFILAPWFLLSVFTTLQACIIVYNDIDFHRYASPAYIVQKFSFCLLNA